MRLILRTVTPKPEGKIQVKEKGINPSPLSLSGLSFDEVPGYL